MNSFFHKITLTCVTLAISAVALALPSWNRVDYTATMAFIGEVRINQYDASFPHTVQENDYIGAFVGNECRMVAKVVRYNSALYVSSVIHGGDLFAAANSGEILEFKLWDAATNSEVPAQIKGTLLSIPNSEILTYIIGKPNENVGAEQISVAGKSLQPAFSNAQKNYEIQYEAGAALPTLANISVVLTDTRATYSVTLPTNFESDNKIIVTVTAEDGTTQSTFTITCNQSSCTTPAPAIASTTINLCVGAPTQSLSASGTNLKWYDGSTLLASAPTISTATPSSKTYSVTQTTTCESSPAQIAVTVHQLPTVSISAAKSEVLSTETSLALTLVPTTGGTLSGSTGVVGLTFDPRKSTLGSQTLTYSYTDAHSCSNTATTTFVVKNGSVASPTIDNTVVNVLVNDPSPVLNANAGGTITWYDENKNKIGEGSSFPTNINTGSEGTYTYYVSSTVEGVESELIEINIYVSNCSTPAPVVSNVNLCVGNPSRTLSASGNNLKWYHGETLLTAAPTITTTTPTTATYFVTQTSSCESAKARIDVVVSALPTVSIASAKTEVLSTETSLTLTLTPATGGTLSGSTGVSGLNFYPNLSTLGSQTLTYSYTDANGCSNTATTTILVKNGVVTPPVLSQSYYTILIGGTVPTITAQGSNVTWLDAAGNVVGSGTSFIPTISTATAGTYTFSVINTNADGVKSTAVTVTIVVQACTTQAPAISIANVKVCEGALSPDLTQYVFGMNVQWFDGSTLLTAAPITNTALTGTKTYYVTQTEECESPRAAITVTVSAKPIVALITGKNEICSTEKLSVSLLPATGIFSGPGTLSGNEFTPTATAIGTHTLSYTVTDANQCSNTATATLTIKRCEEEVKPTKIQVVDKSPLAVGEKFPLQILFTPSNITANVVWEVNNPSIASINRTTGEITGLATGVVKVTAKLASDPSISHYLTISVVPQPVVTGISVNTAGTEVYVTFSEWLNTPKTNAKLDVQIFADAVQYTVKKVTLDNQKHNILVVSLNTPISNTDNVHVSYNGTSISSVQGALVLSFEHGISTDINDVGTHLFKVYPSVAQSVLNVETTAEVETIMIVNTAGQVVLAHAATASTSHIEVSNLAQGNYTVVAFAKNRIVASARFVKK
ncbi:MAG: T9SS type A sorting domain-containing protein [Bacteroidales bacterium]|jgi:hypothetical protein|nr:T9SS type A sorting domain-containing protein [Bacteroidales bacterium]